MLWPDWLKGAVGLSNLRPRHSFSFWGAGQSQPTQDVKGLLGDPYTVKTVSKGEVRWVWVHVNGMTGSSQS